MRVVGSPTSGPPRRWPAMLILGIAGLGSATLRSARLYLVEQALCRAHYAARAPRLIRPDGRVDERFCKDDALQADVALVAGVFEVFTLVCGLLAAPVYTRLASRLGKRRILLLNLCGMAAAAFYSIAVCFFHDTFDIRMMWLAGLFEFVGGGQPVRNALLYAYLAEVVQGSGLKTFYRLSTLQLAMKLLGTVLGAALLEVDVWLLSLLGAAVGALAIPFIALLAPSSRLATAAVPVPATPSAPLLCHAAAAAPPGYGTLPVAGAGGDTANANANATTAKNSPRAPSWDKNGRDGGPTVSVRPVAAAGVVGRHRHRRHRRWWFGLLPGGRQLFLLLRDPLMRVTLLMYLCHGMALSVSVNLPQWAVKRFGYTLAEANAITSLSIVVNGLVLLKAPRFAARILRPALGSQRAADFWIVRTSLIVKVLGIVGVGVAPRGGFHVLALAGYSLGSALTDALRSCVTDALPDRHLRLGLVGPPDVPNNNNDDGEDDDDDEDEGDLRRLYTGISMVDNVAGLAGTALWSFLFSLGMRHGGTALGSVSFYGAAALFVVVLALMRPLATSMETGGKEGVVVV